MSPSLAEVRNRLRAADRALALAPGGSSELARVREAVGSLLVAVHDLACLYEQSLPAAAPPADAAAIEVPAARRRKP
jgi:hypothetical protein